jgi:exonuclease VII small subunit
MVEQQSFEDHQQRVEAIVHSLEEEHLEDIEALTQLLEKITQVPLTQIKPRLQSLVADLVELQETPFHATATPDEWSNAFHRWVESHRNFGLPYLSDAAISRESIYEDER